MIFWAVKDNNDNILVIGGNKPKGTISEAPKDSNGDWVVDGDILTIQDVLNPDTNEVIGQQVVVDEAKKIQKEADLAAAQLIEDQKWQDRNALLIKIEQLKTDFPTLTDQQKMDSIFDILKWLTG